MRIDVSIPVAQQQRSLEFRVAPKGGVSVYGLQRWPITLYAQQWERLLASADDLAEFVRAKDAQGLLTHK